MGARLLNKKLPFEPTFLIFILYFIIVNGILSMLSFFIVMLLHELAHAFVAKKLGYRLDSFVLAPYGASLNYKEKIFENKDEMLVSIAGPMINLFTATVVVSFWWFYPVFYNISYLFVKQSYLFAMFNLLPCYPLDGGRIATAFMQNFTSRERAIKIISILNFVFAIILLLMFLISCFIDFNITFAFGAVFLILSYFSTYAESKYQLINKINKRKKNFSKVKIIYIKKSTSLAKILSKVDQNKFTIFVVCDKKTYFLDEEKVFSFMLKFPLSLSIEEILNQIRNK